MSSQGHKVTILGGTGLLGKVVSRIFLTEFKSSFSLVRVAVRNTDSELAKEFAALGAELVKIDEADLDGSLRRAVDGVDVVLNLLPPNDQSQRASEIAIESGVKVLFPSEFGIDFRVDPWPGYEPSMWAAKRKIGVAIEKFAAGKPTRVILVNNGGFVELLGPMVGLFFQKNTYHTAGSASNKVTLTSLVDVARSLARLSTLALDPATASKVPDNVWIAGNTIPFEEIRDIYARIKNVEKGEIIVEDLDALIKSTREMYEKDPAAIDHTKLPPYFKIAVGTGSFDLSSRAQNELVNPGESLWKWKTIEEHMRQTLL